MRSTWRIENMVLPESSQKMAYTPSKTAYRLVREQLHLPPFLLIHDFRKQNTRRNVSKIFVNHTCYQQIESKSTNHSPQAWHKEGLKVTLVVVIGGFRFRRRRNAHTWLFWSIGVEPILSAIHWLSNVIWDTSCRSRHSSFLARNANENPSSKTSQPLAT